MEIEDIVWIPEHLYVKPARAACAREPVSGRADAGGSLGFLSQLHLLSRVSS